MEDRLTQLFEQALPLDDAGRERVVEQAAREDADLGDALEQLLAADTLADMLGDELPLSQPAVATDASTPDARVGTQVGAWTLTQRLASGFACRYRAVRKDMADTRATLRCLPLGPQTPMQVARFLRERRIAGALVHPGLPLMTDQGLDAKGRPWFALSHAEGEPLVVWCERQRQPLAAVLETFEQACEAVAYAHRHAVLHRQLREDNVVVDAAGSVRVLGFGESGVARATGLPGTVGDVRALAGVLRRLLLQVATEIVPARLAGVVASAEDGAYPSVDAFVIALRGALADAPAPEVVPAPVQAIPAAVARHQPVHRTRWGAIALGLLVVAMAGEIGLLVTQGQQLRDQTAQALAQAAKAQAAQHQAVATLKRANAEVERMAAANAFLKSVFSAAGVAIAPGTGAGLKPALDGAVAKLEQSPPADGLQHVRALLAAASAYASLGENGAALRALQAARLQQERGRGTAAQERAQVRAGLAGYTLTADPRQALTWANEAVTLLRGDVTAAPQVLASTYGVLAQAQASLEDLNGAVASTRLQRQTLLDAGVRPGSAPVVESHVAESRLQTRLGHVDEALNAQEQAIALRGRDSGLEAIDALLERNDYGALLLRAGRADQALAQFQVAHTGLSALRGQQDDATQQAALGIGRAQMALGKHGDAAATLVEVQAYASAHAFADQQAAVAEDLVAAQAAQGDCASAQRTLDALLARGVEAQQQATPACKLRWVASAG